MIWEEEGEAKRVDRIEDDEVVCYLNNRSTGHVSRDRACTWIEVTQLDTVCGQRRRILVGTQRVNRIEVVIQEDQDGDLGL